MNNNRTLLIISGGTEAIAGIQIAKEMGLHVVVSDMDNNAPGFKYADDRIIASTYDAEKTTEKAIQYNENNRRIDGVICIAADVPVSVAMVSNALDLPGISIESARLAMDKLAMKEKFAADGIPIPWFSRVESVFHLKTIVKKQGYPLVIKPTDSRGARGVLLLKGTTELDWAYHHSYSNSPSGSVMVEGFIEGPQVSTESIVLNGKAYTPGFSDRNYEYIERYEPYIIENGGDLPSQLSENIQKSVREVVEQAASSMGITTGIVKGDIVIQDKNPFVIELAARLSGGYFCTHTIPLNTGVEFVKHAIRLALGEKINPDELKPRFQKYICQRFLFPSPGKVTNVSGYNIALKNKQIKYCQVYVQSGDVVKEINCHPARAGVIIAEGKRRQDAISAAQKAVASIKIKTVS